MKFCLFIGPSVFYVSSAAVAARLISWAGARADSVAGAQLVRLLENDREVVSGTLATLVRS